ncbi:MAG: GNAT family N-acetyltransferase [Pseudomonadota bacterium]
MTVEIRELTHPDEVRALEPMVLDYLRIVTTELSNLGIELDPQTLVANMMASVENFLPPLGRSFIAEQNGNVVAMAFLKPLEGNAIELKRLYVRDTARGGGLGRKMLLHTIDVARSMGKTAMFLDTIEPLQPAIALYQAEGFERIAAYAGSEISHIEDVQPAAVYMRADL